MWQQSGHSQERRVMILICMPVADIWHVTRGRLYRPCKESFLCARICMIDVLQANHKCLEIKNQLHFSPQTAAWQLIFSENKHIHNLGYRLIKVALLYSVVFEVKSATNSLSSHTYDQRFGQSSPGVYQSYKISHSWMTSFHGLLQYTSRESFSVIFKGSQNYAISFLRDVLTNPAISFSSLVWLSAATGYLSGGHLVRYPAYHYVTWS